MGERGTFIELFSNWRNSKLHFLSYTLYSNIASAGGRYLYKDKVISLGDSWAPRMSNSGIQLAKPRALMPTRSSSVFKYLSFLNPSNFWGDDVYIKYKLCYEGI